MDRLQSMRIDTHHLALRLLTDMATTDGDDDQSPSQSQEIATRSRWHSLLYEAGGIGAAVSDESMRRLRYCLQWLQVGFLQLSFLEILPLIFVV